MIKSCFTCAMRSELTCLRTGLSFLETWQKAEHCDDAYKGWVPMELRMSWWERIWRFFK